MELLPPARVKAVAAAVVTRLSRSPYWTNALSESTQGTTPTLVQRLDEDDDFYYIVTLSQQERVTARIAIGGFEQRLLQVEGIKEHGAALPPFVDPVAILKRAAAQYPAQGTAVFREDMVGQHPVLVWKPCRESTSRFLPFWLVTVRDRLLYVRVDGTVFTRLTISPEG